MSTEVFQMLQTNGIHQLKMQLALQCSPLLAGLKLSNLLIVNQDEECQVRHLFRDSGIAVRVIYRADSKTTFLLYRPEELRAYLAKAEVSDLLKMFGYEDMQLRDILRKFCREYQSYRRGERDFPHEMGLLLGYPPEDVYGFIINKGQNSLYTGYWKIYGNLADTLKLFERFNQAKELMIRQLCGGMSINDIIHSNHRRIAL